MNPAVENITGSLIRALHARRKPTTINLGIGEPTLKPNVEYFERATRWVADNGCRYSTNIGDPDLRELISKHYAYPAMKTADSVCITTGSQEAVYLAIKALLDPAKDELLLVEPIFPVYGKCAQLEGVPVRKISMGARDDFAIDADTILEAIGPNTRMVVVCSPNNPTGRVISRAQAQKLADGLAARPGPPIWLMHDEIYREIVYTDDAADLGKLYPHTLAINSLSKSNALTGLRLGWIIAPPDVMPAMVKLRGWLTSCPNTFAQRIAVQIFEANDLAGSRPWYEAQRRSALEAARAAGLPFIEPEGAFYLCINVGDPDTLGFAETLIDERDVIAVPCHIFSESMKGWLRTSFVGSIPNLREGYARIAEHAKARGLAVA